MSSAGQAIGGVVGAVVGFFTPLGPVYGAQIGMMIGGVLDPPRTEGPRLEDLTSQTSVYGAFIPRLYGTTAVTGNIIWIQGDRLIEHSVESDGKGGPVVTNFEYFATFAVALCEGPIDGVRRIWIGGQLWYDAGSDDLATIIASNEASATFTLYTGTDTQLADPLIQADRGAANVPAYRGLAYIVFDELPLKDYGNSLVGAQVKVEVVKNGVITPEINLLASLSTGPLGTNPFDIAASNDYLYVVNTAPSLLQVFSVHAPSAPMLLHTVATGANPVSVAIHGSLAYVANSSAATVQCFDVSDQHSPASLWSTSTAYSPISVEADAGLAFVVTAYDMRIFSTGTTGASMLSVTAIPAMTSASMCVDRGLAFIVSSRSEMRIYDIQTPEAPLLMSVTATVSGPTAIKVDGDHAYVTGGTSNLLQVFDISSPSTPSTLSSTATGNLPSGLALNGDYVYICTQNSRTVTVFDVSDRTAPFSVASSAAGNYPASIAGAGSRMFIANISDDAIQEFMFNPLPITSSTSTLGEIVESECLQSGMLTAGDLDVTELTDQVRGYRISSLAPLRGGIDQLRKAWPFDAIQHGYQIKFKKRGGASVATITEGELDARAAGENPGVRISNVREMDLILPQQLTVQYMDSAREYDVNVAEESR